MKKYLLIPVLLLLNACTPECDQEALDRQYAEAIQNCGGSAACAQNLYDEYRRRSCD